MIVPFVDLARQNVAMKGAILSAVTRVVDSGRYLMGPEVARFEKALAEWHGLFSAVAVASGTAACEIAIRACGWHQVGTPAFGAVPTINAIEAAGAWPVLVDVDPRTRGVGVTNMVGVDVDGWIVVHMFGHPCAVPAGAIEDCAHAQGARYGGALVGTFGRAAALSMFPTKCLGNLGDAGAVVTNDTALADKAREIRHYGGLLTGDVTMRGLNSRTSELSAAVLVEKLPLLHWWNGRRREIAARYRAELVDNVTVPYEAPGCEPSYHVFVIEHHERDRLAEALKARGVGCMVHYPKALHEYTRWRHLGEPGQFPVAERLARTVLSLPMFPELTDQEVDHVIASVKAET